MCRWAIIASTVKRPWAGQLKNNGSIPGPVQDFIIFSKASIPVLGPLTPLFTGYVGLFFSPGVKGQCMTPISSFYLVLKLRNIAVSPLTVVYITCSGTNLHCFLSSRIWCWNVDNVCVCFCVLLDQLLLGTEWRTVFDVPKFAKDKCAEGRGNFHRWKVKMSNWFPIVTQIAPGNDSHWWPHKCIYAVAVQR